MARYQQSKNEFIRAQYDSLRIQIATTLRELEKIRTPKGDDTMVLSLDALKLSIKECDDEINNQLIGLIQSAKITPEMGTSLMNGSAYAYNISMYLIKSASTLFANYDEMTVSIEREVALDDDELNEVKIS